MSSPSRSPTLSVCALPRRSRVRTQADREEKQPYFLFNPKRKSPGDMFRGEAKPGNMSNSFQP